MRCHTDSHVSSAISWALWITQAEFQPTHTRAVPVGMALWERPDIGQSGWASGTPKSGFAVSPTDVATPPAQFFAGTHSVLSLLLLARH